MTTRDAELFDVLARGVTDDERRQAAAAITRADTQADQQADQQARRSRGPHPTATQDFDTTAGSGSVAPVEHLPEEQDPARPS
jgi:hypothetical protein